MKENHYDRRDGVVQKLNPLPPSVKCCKDMSEVFLRKIKDIASFDCVEIHIIFDSYLYNSLKVNTRDRRRGKTLKRKYKVADETSLVGVSWKSF